MDHLKNQQKRDQRRGVKSFSTVIRLYNCCNELFHSEIFDSRTRSGATRKANTYLKETFFQPIKKVDIGNYQYWNCYSIADIELNRIEE